MKMKFGWLATLLLLSAACSPESEKVYLKPVKKNEVVTEKPDAVYFDPTVDILFVVDNSPSMGEHQANLASNISLFTSRFSKNSILDYHIGVVTTDMEGWRAGGTLVGNPRVIEKSIPNGDSLLAKNLLVGTSGSSVEQSFEPVIQALSPAMQAGVNRGFYRSSAAFVVIFITDAEDQSRSSAQDLYQFLLKLKGQSARKILSYGVIVPSNVDNCERDENTKPVRIENFLGMVYNGGQGQNEFSLCDPDFGSRLAGMAKDIVDLVGRIIYLNRVPDVDSIRVTYGNMELPRDAGKGWMFDPKKNAIVLGDQVDWASQPFGSRVMIDYKTSHYNDEGN